MAGHEDKEAPLEAKDGDTEGKGKECRDEVMCWRMYTC